MLKNSTAQFDALQHLLKCLDNDFVATLEDGSKCLQIPHNVLRGVVDSRVVKTSLITTESLIRLFLKTQAVFLYEDEYFVGYPLDPDTVDADFMSAFNSVKGMLMKQLGARYSELPNTDNPMETIANACIESYFLQYPDEEDIRSVVILEGVLKKTGSTVKQEYKGLRQLRKAIQLGDAEFESYRILIDGVEQPIYTTKVPEVDNNGYISTEVPYKVEALTFKPIV